MEVPARFEKGLAAVRAAYDALADRMEREPAPGLSKKAFHALAALMKELGLDRASHPQRIDAAALTADQRAVLVALCDTRWIPVNSAADVPRPWPMRRWLGLAPPGILETLGVGLHSTAVDLEMALAEVPANRRVEAYVEAFLAGWTVESRGAFFETLRADAPAALDYARATLPHLPSDVSAAVALFTAFSASNATVPEEAEKHFPLGYRLPGEPLSEPCSTRLLVEHLMAIAEPRRDVVLAAAIQRTRASGTYEAAMHLLERCAPLPRAQDVVRRHLAAKRKKRLTPREKTALVALERRMKALEPSTGKPRVAAAKPAKARSLEVTARHTPRSEADLTPLQAKQLVETGRRWDEQKLAAARRLSLDENDEAALGAVLEHVTVSENGEPTFEAWLHGDSGTFFAVGSTRVVALRGDGATVLEGDEADDTLVAAFSKIGPSKAAVRSVRDVRAATAKGSATPKTRRKKPAASRRR